MDSPEGFPELLISAYRGNLLPMARLKASRSLISAYRGNVCPRGCAALDHTLESGKAGITKWNNPV